MTRTISLITATVGAALLFAVPAYGDNWAAEKAQPSTTISSPDWFERAAAVAVDKHIAMLNARERGLGLTSNQAPVDARSEGLNRLYGLGEYANPIDSRERALVERSQAKPEQPAQGFDARSDGMNRLYGLGEYAPQVVADDRFRIDHSNVPASTSVSSSGSDIEWPTIGFGFGVGLVLILGLMLTLKATHTRPFAH